MATLHGVVPPLITPLTKKDQLDAIHLEKLIEYQLGAGVHGFFLLGTTGEGPCLSHAVKAEVVQRVCQIVAGRVPVLVNVSDTSFVETMQLAKVAAQAGANALVITCPYYFPLDQEDLWKYLSNLIKQLPLPIYLYNMPSHVKVSMGTEVLERAVQEPSILGIKDSSGDRSYFKTVLQIARQRPEWSVMVGPEELFVDVMNWGAQGGVFGGANLYPKVLVQLFYALRAKNRTLQESLVERMIWFHHHVLQLIPRPNGWLVGLKTALAFEGYCEERFAEPLHPMSDAERDMLKKHLIAYRAEQEF
ncbi:MAG TPA: dihydrodipicolinate synthase family protein [Gemmatales bacterium]|nr:dihydrodipicolinate synthase family protein [Gemmatales bacterium]